MSQSEKELGPLRFRVSVSQDQHQKLHSVISRVRTNFRGKRLVELAVIGLAVEQGRFAATGPIQENGAVVASTSTERRKRTQKSEAQIVGDSGNPSQSTTTHYQQKSDVTELLNEALGSSEPLAL